MLDKEKRHQLRALLRQLRDQRIIEQQVRQDTDRIINQILNTIDEEVVTAVVLDKISPEL